MGKLFGMVIVGCVLLGGCAAQTYPVSYSIAVEKLVELYPIASLGELEDRQRLAGRIPAYSKEMLPNWNAHIPWTLVVKHEELSAGAEYEIRINKAWNYVWPRHTTIVVQQIAPDRVSVSVRSERQAAEFIWLRDAAYESQRLGEIHDALVALAR